MRGFPFLLAALLCSCHAPACTRNAEFSESDSVMLRRLLEDARSGDATSLVSALEASGWKCSRSETQNECALTVDARRWELTVEHHGERVSFVGVSALLSTHSDTCGAYRALLRMVEAAWGSATDGDLVCPCGKPAAPVCAATWLTDDGKLAGSVRVGATLAGDVLETPGVSIHLYRGNGRVRSSSPH